MYTVSFFERVTLETFCYTCLQASASQSVDLTGYSNKQKIKRRSEVTVVRGDCGLTACVGFNTKLSINFNVKTEQNKNYTNHLVLLATLTANNLITPPPLTQQV